MSDSVYEIKSLDQMRALTNKIRVKILDVFEEFVPRTNKQIAEALGLPASKVHYHVRELERVGLLQLVDTHEKGGVIEKFYLPVAMQIRVSWNEGSPEHAADNATKLVRKQMLQTLSSEFVDAYWKALEKVDNMIQKHGSIYITEQETEELRQELKSLFEKWVKKCGMPRDNTKPWRIFWTAFPGEGGHKE